MIAAMSPISSDKKSIQKKKLKILWDHHDIMISSFLLAKNGKTMELPWDSHPLGPPKLGPSSAPNGRQGAAGAAARRLAWCAGGVAAPVPRGMGWKMTRWEWIGGKICNKPWF